MSRRRNIQSDALTQAQSARLICHVFIFTPPLLRVSSLTIMHHNSNRATSLAISLLGAIFNVAVAAHLLTFWKTLKREPDSEWESSVNVWKIDGIKLAWALLFTYFVAGPTASLIVFLGIVKVRNNQLNIIIKS